MLERKLRREFRQHWGQNLAITLAIALAVTFFVASRSSYFNFVQTYDDIRTQLHQGDWTLEVTSWDSALIDRIEDIDGVAIAEGRQVLSLPVQLPNAVVGDDRTDTLRLEGRFIGLPSGRQPRINTLELERGRFPSGPDEILVEHHFASFHGIEPTDTIGMEYPGTSSTRELTVSGIAISSEYIWVSRSRQDIMPSPTSFGVFWIDGETLSRHLKHTRIRAILSGRRNDKGSQSPRVSLQPHQQILVRVTPGMDPDQALQNIRSQVGDEIILAATSRDDLPQMTILKADLNSMRGISLFFPIMFLVVGGSVVATQVARTVDSQRMLIGTMLALGVSKARILLHYFSYSLLIGVVGSVIGVAGGVFAGRVVTRLYADAVEVPLVTLGMHPWLLVGGGALGMMVVSLAALLPTYQIIQLLPSQAMRPPAAKLNWFVRLLRHLSRRWPIVLRLAVRNLARRPGRTLASIASVVTALILVLTGAGVIDGFKFAASTHFQESWRYDLRVDVFTMQTPQELQAILATDDIRHFESALTIRVSINAKGTRLETIVQGLATDSELIRPVDFDHRVLRPEDGIVMPTAMARQLGLQAGDSVYIQPLTGGPTNEIVIDSLLEGFGPGVYMRLEKAQSLFDYPGQVNTALLTTDDFSWDLRRQYQEIPQIAALHDVGDMRGTLDNMLKFNYLLMSVMLLFGAILGAAILFTTSTLNITERKHELATMRALGMPFPNIVFMVTLEHLLVAMIGLVVSLPLGAWTISTALSLYESSSLTLALILEPATFLLATMNIVFVLLIAQWPALRAAARLNLADTVRELAAR